ncbi:MAG: hypothetical protein AB2814_00765 [Candidatus Sedimenticola endophacoides]
MVAPGVAATVVFVFWQKGFYGFAWGAASVFRVCRAALEGDSVRAVSRGSLRRDRSFLAMRCSGWRDQVEITLDKKPTQKHKDTT